MKCWLKYLPNLYLIQLALDNNAKSVLYFFIIFFFIFIFLIISGSLDQRSADPGAESRGGCPHQVSLTICNWSSTNSRNSSQLFIIFPACYSGPCCHVLSWTRFLWTTTSRMMWSVARWLESTRPGRLRRREKLLPALIWNFFVCILLANQNRQRAKTELRKEYILSFFCGYLCDYAFPVFCSKNRLKSIAKARLSLLLILLDWAYKYWPRPCIVSSQENLQFITLREFVPPCA